MKSIRQNLKQFVTVFAVVILSHSCTVYKSASISLEQAAKEEKKVKIITKNNENLKFKRIALENKVFYGIKKTKGEFVKIPLDKKWIQDVKLKDNTLSTVLTIIFPIGIIVGTALIFQDSFKWKSNTVDLSF